MKWFKNIFKKQKHTTIDTMKKFDIEKWVPGDHEKIMEKGVMGFDRASLVEMYRGAGYEVNILNEYPVDDNTTKPVPQVRITKDGRFVIPETFTPPSTPTVTQPVNNVPTQEQTPVNTVKTEKPIQVVKQETKYFKIGNIDCKIENGKVYQKQWMRISDSELSEIRIISDKNNKIIPLKDKHLEMLKWVCTENDNND